ncbi:hypothetical protein [Streptomyces sp. XD-27]|uniref:hypothetical protein n=1 Tax=Streptomyces sp. XD-27 TaxID=3062779 RepID=UPI0026F44594|nr:hypothetical protein [Streptomyces sp. XD-27]WKX72880.1 hypothetical protein Q3Y56_25945 [Streptomyces sp. XD-27]
MTGTGGGMGTTGRGALDWLVSAALDPGVCRWEWERSPLGVALLPAGRLWDVLVLPGELGAAALEVLCRRADRPGPVVTAFGGAQVGYFVPAGTTGRWLGTGVRGVSTGAWVVVPHPGRASGGMRWLVAPDGSGRLTDPVVLELAMHEAAARLVYGG